MRNLQASCKLFAKSPGVVERSCKASAKQILRCVNEKQATFAVEILQASKDPRPDMEIFFNVYK